MKLSTFIAIIIAAATSVLRGAAARSIVTPLSGINLFPAANYEIDVNGVASLSPAFLGQNKEKVGPEMINAAMDVVSQVQTLRLTGTSPWQKQPRTNLYKLVSSLVTQTKMPNLTLVMASFVFLLSREPSSRSMAMVVHLIALL